LPYRTLEKMELETNINELKIIGWKANFTIYEGLNKTIEIEKSEL